MWPRNLILLPALVCLSACGTYAPQIQEVWDQDYPGIPSNDPKKYAPPMSATAQIEYEILNRVRCDLALAVEKAAKFPVTTESGKPAGFLLPADYQAQVALSLEVDESTALNPGISFTTPLHNATTNFAGEYLGASTPLIAAQTFSSLSSAQSYAFGLGGTISTTATRNDKYNPIWPVSQLVKEAKECSPRYDAYENLQPPFTPAKSSFLITSDLKIGEWLRETLTTIDLFKNSEDVQKQSGKKKKSGNKNQQPASTSLQQRREDLVKKGYTPAEITQIVAAEAAPTAAGTSGVDTAQFQPQTFSIEIKFIVVTSGNATPSWKLVRVTANNASPLFSVGRTRTHDLIITVGPRNANATNAHLASQIGAAVQGSSTGQ